MKNIDLTKYGINGVKEIVYNPSYEMLFEEETKPTLEGYEKGQVSELGAVNVMTGIYTGRSPKDKYIVVDENSKDTVWWTSDEYKNDNHPATEATWAEVKKLALKELSNNTKVPMSKLLDEAIVMIEYINIIKQDFGYPQDTTSEALMNYVHNKAVIIADPKVY